MKNVWCVKPVTTKSAYAICVLADDEQEAIEKAKRSRQFYLIEQFGPQFEAKLEMGGNEITKVWFYEWSGV